MIISLKRLRQEKEIVIMKYKKTERIYTPVESMAHFATKIGKFGDKAAYRYFDHELTAGTPFTFEGATELMRLGIFVICINLVSAVLAQVAHGIISAVLENVEALTLEGGDSVALGVMLIVLSVFCRYGAELVANQASKEQNSDEQN